MRSGSTSQHSTVQNAQIGDFCNAGRRLPLQKLLLSDFCTDPVDPRVRAALDALEHSPANGTRRRETADQPYQRVRPR